MQCRHHVFVAVLLAGSLPHLSHAQTPASVLRLPAQVEPYERVAIYAKASGFVARVLVDIGDQVQQGQLLAELSIPEMEQEKLRHEALVEQADAATRQAAARVESARAQIIAAESLSQAATARLARHEADISFARSELVRITDLVRSRSLNAAMQDEKRQQLQAAEAGLLVARAEIRSAEAVVQVEQSNLRQAEADLAYAHSQLKVAQASLQHTLAVMKYTQITAPFDGQITLRSIDTGDFVTSAASSKTEPLFSLNSIGRFRIVFDVPESSATKIQIGQPVELKVDSLVGEAFNGSVRRTAGQLDRRTRTLRVEAELDSSQTLTGVGAGRAGAAQVDRQVAGVDRASLLRPGMFGMVSLTLSAFERPTARE